MARREDGFTLIELLVVLMLIAVLSAAAISFHRLAREQAGDAAAKSNIRVAVPAIEAYRQDTGSYSGMTVAGLQGSYSPGVEDIEVLSAGAESYCVRSRVGSRSWHKLGPSGPITTTPCA